MDCIPKDDETALTKRKCFIRKSVSTVGFTSGCVNLDLREAKSFTGALEELKNLNVNPNKPTQLDHSIRNQQRKYKDKNAKAESGCITTEVFTNQVFIVTEDMLMHRGKNYTLNDIAIRWKKDCRMWLWKSKPYKKKNSIAELKEQMQSLKIPQ